MLFRGAQGDARVDMMETPQEVNFTYAKIRNHGFGHFWFLIDSSKV